MATKKNVVSKALAAAMGAETSVPVPTKIRAASMVAVLVDLEVDGQPASRAVRIDSDTPAGELQEVLSVAKEKLRDNVQSSVNGARRRLPDANYRIECTDVRLPSGSYVIAIVTRIA